MADFLNRWLMLSEVFTNNEYNYMARDAQISSRFQVREQFTDRHVVIPDVHGEHRFVDRVVAMYGDEPDISFVFLGDVVDRKGPLIDQEKGVFKSLELIKDLGSRAVLTMGNHEWLLLASSYTSDPAFREEQSGEWLGDKLGDGIERNVLVSYDMDPNRRDHTTSDELMRRMARAGHLEVLTGASPYFETAECIVVHAGLLPAVDWSTQRSYLEEVAKEMDYGLFYDRPPQWFSMRLAVSTEPNACVSKTVISGHAHVLGRRTRRYPDQSADRILHAGKRIRLASTLNAPTNANAYIYQDWDRAVVEIPADGGPSRLFQSGKQ